ncbi:MAG: adenylyl-sulfate kinase [Deltaproteobacteria bacterium]|nr:adenylyl-sulfate kinase [Deltaproteobacteria bacterium]
MSPKATNVYWQETKISKSDRIKKLGHKSFVIWFTGLSAAGKTTIATALEKRLFDQGAHTYLLDGDNMRHGLNKDLGFSAADREENIRRVGEVAGLMVDAGLVVLTAFISPFRAHREQVRNLLQQNEFIEVFVKCSLEVCEKRDPKGLYQKARKGEVRDFTGIDSEYEAPLSPELILDSENQNISDLVEQVVSYLKQNDYLSS